MAAPYHWFRLVNWRATIKSWIDWQVWNRQDWGPETISPMDVFQLGCFNITLSIMMSIDVLCCLRLIQKTESKMRPAMGQILKEIWYLLRPSISRQKALTIAQRQCMPPIDAFQIYDSEPSGWCIYGLKDDEEYWYVQRSSDGDGGALASSHAIVISKKTGDVVYDGFAHDEG